MSRAAPPRTIHRVQPARRLKLRTRLGKPYGGPLAQPPTTTSPFPALGLTLFFEGTASGGGGLSANHGRSGETSQTLPFTGSASSYQHVSLAATLPRLTVPDTNHISPNNSATLAATLPVPFVSRSGAGGILGTVLPSLTGSATGTIPLYGRLAATLPHLTGAAHALIGSLATVAAILPRPLGMSARRGWAFPTMALPLLQATITGYTPRHVTVAANLPRLLGAGAFHRISVNASCNVILPMLLGPGLSIDTAAVLPKLMLASGSMTNGTPAVSQAWAMNLDNKAMTQFTNYPFRAIARAFNTYYAVGFDGNIYQLGGDDDNGVKVDWQWRTGLSDLGTRGLKGVLGVYIDGVVEPGATIEVVLDTGVYSYTHRPRGPSNSHQTQRVSVGRGLRSANIGLGMSGGLIGGYVEIDSLTPEYVVSNRNL